MDIEHSNRVYGRCTGFNDHEVNMKNKIFSIVLVVSIIFLAIIWNREHQYRSRIDNIGTRYNSLQTRLYMLELKAKALKLEMQMVEISNHIKIIKGWK